MSAKHTPGPWSLSPAEDGVIEAQDGEDFICVAVAGNPEAACRQRDLANARLIAAAPDLLEALRNLVGGIDASARGAVLRDAREMIAARAAIAKATGA